eukprot:COSAG01_NODE_1343_length_10640_cov_46.844322_7_plen_138_part_00
MAKIFMIYYGNMTIRAQFEETPKPSELFADKYRAAVRDGEVRLAAMPVAGPGRGCHLERPPPDLYLKKSWSYVRRYEIGYNCIPSPHHAPHATSGAAWLGAAEITYRPNPREYTAVGGDSGSGRGTCPHAYATPPTT